VISIILPSLEVKVCPLGLQELTLHGVHVHTCITEHAKIHNTYCVHLNCYFGIARKELLILLLSSLLIVLYITAL